MKQLSEETNDKILKHQQENGYEKRFVGCVYSEEYGEGYLGFKNKDSDVWDYWSTDLKRKLKTAE